MEVHESEAVDVPIESKSHQESSMLIGQLIILGLVVSDPCTVNLVLAITLLNQMKKSQELSVGNCRNKDKINETKQTEAELEIHPVETPMA